MNQDFLVSKLLNGRGGRGGNRKIGRRGNDKHKGDMVLALQASPPNRIAPPHPALHSVLSPPPDSFPQLPLIKKTKNKYPSFQFLFLSYHFHTRERGGRKAIVFVVFLMRHHCGEQECEDEGMRCGVGEKVLKWGRGLQSGRPFGFSLFGLHSLPSTQKLGKWGKLDPNVSRCGSTRIFVFPSF